MEQIIQKVLEMDPIVVYFAVLLFAFVPGSCVVCIRKLNRWIKTVTVLLFGEMGAVALFVLAQAAKAAGTSNFLADFTAFSIVFAILTMIYAIIGHVFHWDHRVVRGLKKDENSKN